MSGFFQTVTPNLQESIEFFQRLEFKQDVNHPQVFHEGGQIIFINFERIARAGLRFYADSWTKVVSEIEKLCKVHQIEGGYAFADPSNSWVYLLESEAPTLTPPAMPSKSILGNFAGLSLESGNIELSIAIYQILGFKIVMGSIEQGWISLENDQKMGIGLMVPNNCPHLFFNPSFSYFNGGKNEEIIPLIQEKEIAITEEITVFNADNKVDNIILRDPGGFGFFIFND